MITLDINISAIIQCLNFLFLIWAMNMIVYRPIRKILRKRAEVVAQLGADITRDFDSAASDQETIKEKQLLVRQEGMRLREDKKLSAREEELKQLQIAGQESDKYLEAWREKMQAELVTAKQSLEGQIQVFAKDLAGKILQRSLS